MNRRKFLQIIGVTSASLPFLKITDLAKDKTERIQPHGLYRIFREKILDGDLDWENSTVKVSLTSGDDYTPDLESDRTLDDIPQDKIVTTSEELTGKTQENAVLDADDVWIPAVAGNNIDYLILYRPDCLVACIGLSSPITPNGGDLNITWDNSPNKIVRLL
jgi:hypothetical protein